MRVSEDELNSTSRSMDPDDDSDVLFFQGGVAFVKPLDLTFDLLDKAPPTPDRPFFSHFPVENDHAGM